MKNLMKKVRGFIVDEEGQGLVEYALILVLVALVAIVAMTLLGKKVENTYNNAAQKIPY